MVASAGLNILARFRRAWELNRTSIAVLRPYGWLLAHISNVVAYVTRR